MSADQNIEFREFGAELLDEVKSLYREAGWQAYLSDDERLKTAFRSSLWVLGAFDHDRLIGFVRCVGDGGHIVLIQDVLVAASYRRRGVGSALVNAVLERYASVRMISLYTDAEDEADNRFYRSLGFRTIDENHMISYMK